MAVRLSLKKNIEAKERASKLKLEYQQKLLENSILTQERERARIAADIHDELIGKLTAIKVANHMNENSGEMNEMLSKSIQIARRISHDLMPPLIDFSSLEELIREIASPWQSKITIDMTFNVPDNISVSSDIKIHFVRIIQEILVNIAKHSQSTTVTLHLRITALWTSLTISDYGEGFDPKSIKNGLGLTNIETRTQYMKGHYKLKSIKGKGTSFIFLVPTALKINE